MASTIADSILNILRSKERKQETSTSQSLQAMSLSLESERADRRLLLEERKYFDEKTDKLAAKVEARKQDYLGTIYTQHFMGDFQNQFKDFMEEGGLFKEAALDVRGSDGYDGLIKKYVADGFSKNDAKKIVANLYSYVSSGKTSSTNMQEIVDMFVRKSKDLNFLTAAVKSGIFSGQGDNFLADIENFRRSRDFDIASLGLLAESAQSVGGDLEYDFNYDKFISGGKLERLKGDTQAFEQKKEPIASNQTEGKRYYDDKSWANKIDGVEYNEEDTLIGKSGFRLLNHNQYDPQNPNKLIEYKNVQKNIENAEDKSLEANKRYNALQLKIKNSQSARKNGLASYSEMDELKDTTLLMQLDKEKDVYNSYLQDNEKVLDTLEDEYQVMFNVEKAKSINVERVTIPDVDVDIDSKNLGRIETYKAQD
jgi:hypothetical protein